MYNYESPIHTYTQRVAEQMAKNLDGEILTAVVRCGVSVDKDELIRALKYDRDQYYKGYQDAMRDKDLVEVVHGRWVEADDGDGAVCSVCGEDFCNVYLEVERFNYCPNCGADMRERKDDDAE